MKAVVWTKYGPPDVLQLREVAKPTPKHDEVLVRNYAASVSTADCELRAFKHFSPFWLPLLPVVHLDFAKDEPIVVHCAHAVRSTVAISLLARQGYRSLALLGGGFSGWQKAGYPVEGDGG